MHRVKKIAKIGLFLVSALSFAGFISVKNEVDVSAYSLTVSASDSVSVDVVPDFGEGIGATVVEDEVGIMSDCRAGYSFVIQGPSDNNLYLNGDSDNNDDGTYFAPVDGSNALDDSVNTNKWGYSLTASSRTGVFSALSSTSAVLKTPAQTVSPDSDIDTTLSIYYGSSVSDNMTPGNYTFANGGQISYQVVMDVSCIPGIHYESNGADAGEMETQEVAAGAGVYLVPPNYSREGYGFASWNTSPDGTGTNYGPNEYITMPDSGTLVLYPNWVASSGDLQGWTGCSSLSINDVIGLTDTRDGNVYAVAKLADGKCWMVENLRLDLEGADINVYNTNNPSSAFLEKLVDVTPNTGEWCVRTAPEAYYDVCEEEMNYNINNIDRSLEASYNANGIVDVSWYSYGVLYNNYTATAGGGRFNNGNRSICPIGWKLPTGVTRTGASFSQDYHALMHAWDDNYQVPGKYSNNGVNSKLAFAYPNNFIVSGSYGQAIFSGRGVVNGNASSVNTAYWALGGYMSGVGNSFRLYSNSGDIIQVSDASLARGYNVRCIIEDNTENYTLNYNTNGGDTSIPADIVSANKVYHFTISSTVPQRAGYSFKWWIDKDGNEYNPGDTFITIESDSTLYAIWENNSCNSEAETISQAVCLQDINDAVKATMVSKQTYILRDARDNKQYTVSLLDDGEVWMTQSLNVGRNDEMVLSSSDTDIENEYHFLPAQTTTFASNNKTIQYELDNQYGGYYSWPAAILSSASYTEANQAVSTSICPFGWDLPLESHYNNLISRANIGSYSSAAAPPYNFVRSGFVNTNGISNVGTQGLYWTAVVTSYSYQSGSYAKNVNLDSTFRVEEYGGSRYVGGSIRCIASNGNGTINYNANGGSGSMDSQNNIGLNDTKIVENSFTEPNEHKQFREWNTRADGSGTAVKPGEAASMIKNDLVGGEVTLYAQWDDIYIVTFNNTYSGASETRKVVVGKSTYSVSSVFWDNDREYYELKGWDTNPNGQTVVYEKSGFVPTSDLSLYTVWSPLYLVSYDGNGADSGSMDYEYNLLRAGDRLILLGNDFARTGYGFVGWSIDSSAAPGDGVSTIYGPEQDFIIPSGLPAGSLVLYAIWVEADSNNDMQSFGVNGVCNTLSIGDVVGLDDARDSNTYAVAKLASGDCWMMENLRLDPTQATINSQNTDGPTSDFISALSNYPSPYDGCDDDTDSNCVDSIGFNDDNLNRNITKDRWDDKYINGIKYNWYTATAGNGNYNTVNNETAIGSICPNGWHLAKGTYWGEDGSREGDVDGLRDAFGRYYDWQQGLVYPNNFLTDTYWTSNMYAVYNLSGVVTFDSDGMPDLSRKVEYLPMRCVADRYEYTIGFSDVYGYSGSMNDIVGIKMGDTVTLPNTGFDYGEYAIFVGWSFEEYNIGDYDINKVYSVGATITMNRELRARALRSGRMVLYPVLDHNPNY